MNAKEKDSSALDTTDDDEISYINKISDRKCSGDSGLGEFSQA